MRICVLQYDDRSDDVLGDQRRLANRNEEIASQDGATYTFERTPDGTHPPYWQKVASVRRLMDADRCGAVMFMDTDAVLRAPPSRLAQQLGHKSFLMSGDMPPWKAEFNAGVWMVKNDPSGRAIMDEWLAQYDPKAWSRATDGSWRCTSSDAVCEWAGRAYEQGAFIPVMQRNQAAIERVGWETLQHPCGVRYDDALACHFAGAHKSNIKEFIRNDLSADE